MEEITISPNPEWVNEFKKIIMEKYNLSLLDVLDAACITGRAEKTVKKLKKEYLDKACEWIDEYFPTRGNGETTFSSIEDVKECFRKAMEEQL